MAAWYRPTRIDRRRRRSITTVRYALATAAALLTVTACGSTSEPEVWTLAIAPASATIAVGSTTQLTARLTNAAGDSQTPSTVTWTSNDPAVSTVDAFGIVTGRGRGVTTITATAEGQSAEAAVTVEEWTLSITPATTSLLVGGTAQFEARLTEGGDDVRTPSAVTWTSGNAVVSTVDADGLATGHCAGVTTVTASAEGQTAHASVTVVPVAEIPPFRTYTEWSPRVLESSSADSLWLRVRIPDASSPVQVDLAGGGAVPLCQTGGYTYQVALAASSALSGYVSGDLHNFVGYLEFTSASAGSFRGNLFVNVKDATVPDVTVTQLSATMQHSDHVVNLRYDELLLGNAAPADVIQTFYASFPDDYDFLAVVQQVETFANRYYSGVRNATAGIGLSAFDWGQQFGSAARLQGIITYPIAVFFDLGETGAPHEIGHRWINFLQYPLLGASAPHWPISSLAHGIMGFNIPGSFVGGQFPFRLDEQQNGDYLLVCVGPGREYLDLELYLMGLLPPDSVGGHFVFDDQNQGAALNCGGVLRGPVQHFTVAHVIAADGPRSPAWPDAQRDFRIATIVLSAGRLLSASEMAFFDHMAARGSATEELRFTSGFASGMTKPFYLATGGRGTLDTRLR